MGTDKIPFKLCSFHQVIYSHDFKDLLCFFGKGSSLCHCYGEEIVLMSVYLACTVIYFYQRINSLFYDGIVCGVPVLFGKGRIVKGEYGELGFCKMILTAAVFVKHTDSLYAKSGIVCFQVHRSAYYLMVKVCTEGKLNSLGFIAETAPESLCAGLLIVML